MHAEIQKDGENVVAIVISTNESDDVYHISTDIHGSLEIVTNDRKGQLYVTQIHHPTPVVVVQGRDAAANEHAADETHDAKSRRRQQH